MEQRTTASTHTGGGLWDIGAMMAGFTPVWGVEIRPDIAAVAERNIPGLKVIVSDVAAVDYSSLPKVDHLHASPSCKNASVASDGEEAPEDLSSAMAICRAIREVGPQSFTLENVWGYREFDSFKLIVGQLTRLGYKVDWWHLNASDYGVPQTRKRLILIAHKDRQPRKPTPTHSKTPDPFGIYKPWVGWLESIADLVDTLPGSEFAPWQVSRLPDELKSMLLAQGGYKGGIVNRSIEEPSFTVTSNSNQAGVRAYLVNSENQSRDLTIKQADSPAFSVANGGGTYPRAFLLNRNKSERDDHYKPGSDPAYTVCVESNERQRAFLVNKSADKYGDGLVDSEEPCFTVVSSSQGRCKAFTSGRVVKMTPRALARFQSVPDNYQLPDANGLACEIVGNALPPLLAKAICESLKD